jgi:hypothetical protein
MSGTPNQLAGGTYTPSSLAAVFEADSKSIDDADDAKKAAAQKVLDAQATHATTAIVLSALARRPSKRGARVERSAGGGHGSPISGSDPPMAELPTN